MFLLRQIAHNPIVIRRKDLGGNRFVYKLEEKQGVYWRVIPSNMKEIKFMLLLEKHLEYEIPACGNGLLITDRIIPLA
tara:strand:+ start:37773 stop:38006 length:234 start_codon:yes stop_codon:yes gene_type:complete